MPTETLPLGRIAGIRIGVHWSVLVTIALFTWILHSTLTGRGSPGWLWIIAAIGALALIASLAAHELAHSVVARRGGVGVDRIVLWLLGGVSELSDEPRDARTDLRIAIAGPVTSLLLAAGGFVGAVITAAFVPGTAVVAVLVWLSATNALLALFNLLPGAPLDGGRVMRALIWARTGDRLRAATAAARSGRTLGTVLMVLGVGELIVFHQLGGLWLLLLGWYLQTAALGELAVAGLRHRLGDSRIRDVMTSPALAVPAQWSIDRLLHSSAPDSGHRVFPVVDLDGHPLAVLAWSDVVAVPAATRATTQISGVARRLPPGGILAEDGLLADAATRVVLRPSLDAIAVVDPAGRLTGIVTATDLATACDRSALGLPIRKTHSPTLFPAPPNLPTA
ncbi:site-2 protease family protein [Nocardia pseudobrasiliensis]|uniref:Zinc metalloprotease n=1 Tax=Nocardia pseudobrasiliensis TaxID=45979 RepID=A0A370IDQ5_9NOCA|nr:site-2 protease family protein [Nocardia pseudobrasiliensis]RDI68291.1 Zn-dependent protease [Nocardia pseudobrasiliensis]